MPLRDGDPDLDSVVLRFPDYGREIKHWTNYSFSRTFLSPTAEWSFTIGEQDIGLSSELLALGAAVELVINGAVQCSGFVEDIEEDAAPESGTVVTVKGGDILNQVVKATMDPAYKFNAGMTLPQFVLSVLTPFGITTVFNSDEANIKAMTGFAVRRDRKRCSR